MSESEALLAFTVALGIIGFFAVWWFNSVEQRLHSQDKKMRELEILVHDNCQDIDILKTNSAAASTVVDKLDLLDQKIDRERTRLNSHLDDHRFKEKSRSPYTSSSR